MTTTTSPAEASTDLDVPRALQIRILHHLVRDHWTGERTAREMNISRDTVQAVASTYGRIPQRLAIALDHLEDEASAEAEESAGDSEQPEPGQTVDELAAADAAEEETVDAGYEELALARALARGMGSSSKRIRTRAERIRADLVDLVGRLEADKEAEARRQRVADLEAKRAKLAAEIAELKSTSATTTSRATRKGGVVRAVGKGKWVAYRADDGTYPCPDPDCEMTPPNGAGLALHLKANPDHLRPAPGQGAGE